METSFIPVKRGDLVAMPGWFSMGQIVVRELHIIGGVQFAVVGLPEPEKCFYIWLIVLANMCRASDGWIIHYDDVKVVF